MTQAPQMPTSRFALDDVQVKVKGEKNGLKEVQHEGIKYNTGKKTMSIKLGEGKYLTLKESFLNHDIGVVINEAPEHARMNRAPAPTQNLADSQARVKVSGTSEGVTFYRASSVEYNPRTSSLDVKIDRNHIVRLSNDEMGREMGIQLDAFDRNLSRAR